MGRISSEAADRELVQGLIDGDAALATELLRRVRPMMRHFVIRRHAELRDWHDEILGAAEARLFEWRAAQPCLLRPNEALLDLAERAVHQEAQREARYRRGKSRVMAESQRPPNAPAEDEADGSIRLRDVTHVFSHLPEDEREVLFAQRQYQVGLGRPIDRVLGLSAEAARKRLQRARNLFLQKLIERGIADAVKEPS